MVVGAKPQPPPVRFSSPGKGPFHHLARRSSSPISDCLPVLKTVLLHNLPPVAHSVRPRSRGREGDWPGLLSHGTADRRMLHRGVSPDAGGMDSPPAKGILAPLPPFPLELLSQVYLDKIMSLPSVLDPASERPMDTALPGVIPPCVEPGRRGRVPIPPHPSLRWTNPSVSGKNDIGPLSFPCPSIVLA